MPTNAAGYGWAGDTYRAFRVERPVPLDGRLDKPVWEAAPRTKRFVDIGTGGPAPFDTHAAIVWDDSALYISFAAQDPYVTAVNTERDSLVFFENDLEVLIDGGESYYELEFNAFGTVYEVFYIWRDSYQGGESGISRSSTSTRLRLTASPATTLPPSPTSGPATTHAAPAGRSSTTTCPASK